MDQDVYENFVEVEPMTGSELLIGSKGGFVSCYVPSGNLENSIALLKERLSRDNLKLIDLQQVVRINMEEWVPYDQHYPTKKDLQNAIDHGGIIYGPFETYDSDYEH